MEKNLKENILSKIVNKKSSVGIISFNVSDGKIIFADNYSALFLEYNSSNELLDSGNTFFSFLFENNIKELQDNIKSNKEISNLKLKFNLKNNITKHALFFLSLEDNDLVNCILIDVTKICETRIEAIKLKEKEEHANKEKTLFMTNMSHELRTSLNAIFGMTELLFKTDLTNKQFEYVNIVTKSSENLLAVVNDLLDISKIESGKLFIENVSFRLKDVLTSSFNTVYYSAHQKGLKLVCDHLKFGDTISLKGDPVRLNQIFINILDNSIKYTEKGNIEIKVNILNEIDDNVEIRFDIIDTGIGISEEKLNDIFDSFSQTGSTTQNKISDLGLIIANHLTQLMQGRIEVESKVNEGSKFSIFLLFKKEIDENVINTEDIQKEISEPLVNNVKVLLAEDQAFNQIVVVNILHDLGYSIDVVENGLQAIDKLKSNDYDIILMDIQMPEMDGLKATKIIRDSFPEPVCNIPIIAITANAFSDDHKSYLESGMNETISKPFRSHELFQKITTVLKIKHVGSKQDKIDINTFYNYTLKEKDGELKLYDLSLLENISKGKPDMMIEMLETFVARTDEELMQLKQYCLLKDWENSRKIVHKMKPSISYLGMKKIENKIINVQRIVKEEKNYENLDREIEYIEKLLKKSFSMLNNEIDKLKLEL